MRCASAGSLFRGGSFARGASSRTWSLIMVTNRAGISLSRSGPEVFTGGIVFAVARSAERTNPFSGVFRHGLSPPASTSTMPATSAGYMVRYRRTNQPPRECPTRTYGGGSPAFSSSACSS
jgi:hypothetical protein